MIIVLIFPLISEINPCDFSGIEWGLWNKQMNKKASIIRFFGFFFFTTTMKGEAQSPFEKN